MEGVEHREFKPIQWEDALVIVAFPATGSVASIAGHYLQQKLELPLVGCFVPQPAAPIIAIRNGVATSPIRIFGGETECDLPRGKCQRLYVILSDLPLNPKSMARVSAAIIETANAARLILCLDGMTRAEGDDVPDVWSVAPDEDTLEELALNNVKPLTDAYVNGTTGHLLLEPKGANVGALIVEALADMPDGRAAAALIKAIDQLLPLVPVDPEPLVQEALILEAEIRRAQDDARKSGDLHSFI